MWANILRVVLTLFAGVGAGAIADKVAPDANLNVVGDVVKSTDESGMKKIDFVKVAKWVGLTIAGALLVNIVFKALKIKTPKIF